MLTRIKLVGLPCLLLLCCTLPHLDQGDFNRDSGRYAAVGLYMWTDGQLGVPYLNPDTPYFNKPPLAMAIHGLFLKLFHVHVAVAKFPSILAALGVLILSVLTLERIASRVEALVSGLILATTYEFFRRTHEISLDFWQLLFVMLAVYLVVRSLQQSNPVGLLLAGVPIGLALLCKPLMALGVLPILAGWALLQRQRRAAIWLLVGTPVVALMVAGPWHWYMWHRFGPAFIKQYFGHEVLERAEGKMATNPLGHHFQILAQTYWPWMLAVAWAAWHRWSRAPSPQRRPARDAVWLGGSWVAYVLLLLSLFPDKKVNYALPVYPMLSWVAAAGLCRLGWPWLRAWRERAFAGLAPAAAGLLVLLSVLPIQFQPPPNKDWQALLRWLHEQHIPPATLYYRDLIPNLVCYYYLKTGVFPKPAPTGTNEPANGRFLILTQENPQALTNAPESVVFNSGGLTIISLAGTNRAPVEPSQGIPPFQSNR
ncbi:MAG TPA: glycosyltransferase family 39 protein [Candidatus Acidoferrum sp.]|nr:glycosyltransferase family 39 protein [Candidatus Acidoferrum sp.]